MHRFFSFFLLLACGAPQAPELPVLEETAEPRPISSSAIESANASSSLKYKSTVYGPEFAFDGDSSTAWCEGGRGVNGDWISVDFKKPMTFTRITVEGGFYRSDKTLIKNGRVREMTILADGNWTGNMSFEYVPERMHKGSTFMPKQTQAPLPPKTRTLRFTIDKADKGHTTSDVCISEIRFFEGP